MEVRPPPPSRASDADRRSFAAREVQSGSRSAPPRPLLVWLGVTLGFSDRREATADSPRGFWGDIPAVGMPPLRMTCRRGFFPVGGPRVLPGERVSGLQGVGKVSPCSTPSPRMYHLSRFPSRTCSWCPGRSLHTPDSSHSRLYYMHESPSQAYKCGSVQVLRCTLCAGCQHACASAHI